MRAIRGSDSNGNPVEIRPGQRFTLAKFTGRAYELAKDGSHRRVTHKQTGKQRRAARKQGRTL